MKKRIVIAVLSAMLLAFLAVTVSAGVRSYDDLFVALGEDCGSLNDGNIMLLSDVTLTEPVVISEGEYVILGAGVEIHSGEAAFVIEKGAKLVLGTNESAAGSECIVFKGGSETADTPFITVNGELEINTGVFFDGRVSSENGGAVVNNGKVTANYVSIKNCRSVKNGGGIFNSGELVLLGGEITSCSAENGGAVFNAEGGNVTLGGTEITKCSAENGGGIYSEGIFGLIGSSVSDCTATNGGALFNGGEAALTGGQIASCTAKNGGSVYNSGKIIHTATYVNGGSAELGGNLYNVGEYGQTEGYISSGIASVYGGNVYNGGTYTISGGSCSSGSAKRGGGTYNTGIMNVRNGSFSLNKAEYGEAIFTAGELHFSEFPYVDKKCDVFVLLDENSASLPYVDSEMKADVIACLSFGYEKEDGITETCEVGMKVLQGEFAGKSASKFILSAEGYEIDGNAAVRRIKTVWEKPLTYVILVLIYAALVAGFTVMFMKIRKKQADGSN